MKRNLSSNAWSVRPAGRRGKGGGKGKEGLAGTRFAKENLGDGKKGLGGKSQGVAAKS